MNIFIAQQFLSNLITKYNFVFQKLLFMKILILSVFVIKYVINKIAQYNKV